MSKKTVTTRPPCYIQNLFYSGDQNLLCMAIEYSVEKLIAWWAFTQSI